MIIANKEMKHKDIKGENMTEILVASHGHFASGLKNSIEILTGMGDKIQTIDAYVDQSDYTKQIIRFIENAQHPAVIFTDLRGGSVNQKVVLEAVNKKNIFVVTQTNLAIVMAVLLDNEKLTRDHIQDLINQSQVELCQIDDSQTESNDADEDFFE